ncbi:hypothetical protein [Furfurilactobacillus curtus]|uniref:Uncharacterized protein n=1 Tax=Furfurilactobacillus curtus TaxID=1746200 RepID=A0ABQ5JPU8_9LACO
MNHLIETIVSVVMGSSFTGYLTYRSTIKKNQTDREDIYADHTGELWDRLDKITSERDELKAQVIKLQTKVEEQSRMIDDMTHQIGKLTKEVKEMMEDK